MQSSMQNAENPSTAKDATKLSETAMSDDVIYDTIDPQEQSAYIHENSNEELKEAGITNPIYSAQLKATKNPYSCDASYGEYPHSLYCRLCSMRIVTLCTE